MHCILGGFGAFGEPVQIGSLVMLRRCDWAPDYWHYRSRSKPSICPTKFADCQEFSGGAPGFRNRTLYVAVWRIGKSHRCLFEDGCREVLVSPTKVITSGSRRQPCVRTRSEGTDGRVRRTHGDTNVHRRCDVFTYPSCVCTSRCRVNKQILLSR